MTLEGLQRSKTRNRLFQGLCQTGVKFNVFFVCVCVCVAGGMFQFCCKEVGDLICCCRLVAAQRKFSTESSFCTPSAITQQTRYSCYYC